MGLDSKVKLDNSKLQNMKIKMSLNEFTILIIIYDLIALIIDFTILRFADRISLIWSISIIPSFPATRFKTKRNLSQISQSPSRCEITFSSSSNSALYAKNFIKKSSLYNLFAFRVMNKLFNNTHCSKEIKFLVAPRAKKTLSVIKFCFPAKT